MRTVTALDIIEDVTKVAENTCLKEIKRKPSIFEVSFSLLRKMGLEGEALSRNPHRKGISAHQS